MNVSANTHPRWLGAIPILVILIIWEVACRAGSISPAVLPPPSAIAARGVAFFTDPHSLTQLGITMRRLASGLALAIVIGTTVGICASLFRATSQILEILIGILAPLPKIALYPALLLTLGFNDAPKIALVSIDATFPIIIATFQAAQIVDKKWLWSAASMGTPRWRALRKIVLPACLPAIITGIRVGSVIGCIVVLLAEMLASTNGLGHMLVSASRSFRTADVFVPIVIMSVVGFSLDKILSYGARAAAHH